MNDHPVLWRVLTSHPEGYAVRYFNSYNEAWDFASSPHRVCSLPHSVSLFDAIKEQSNGK